MTVLCNRPPAASKNGVSFYLTSPHGGAIALLMLLDSFPAQMLSPSKQPRGYMLTSRNFCTRTVLVGLNLGERGRMRRMLQKWPISCCKADNCKINVYCHLALPTYPALARCLSGCCFTEAHRQRLAGSPWASHRSLTRTSRNTHSLVQCWLRIYKKKEYIHIKRDLLQ